MALENACKQRDANTAVRNKKVLNDLIKLKNIGGETASFATWEEKCPKVQRRVLSGFLLMVPGHT